MFAKNKAQVLEVYTSLFPMRKQHLEKLSLVEEFKMLEIHSP